MSALYPWINLAIALGICLVSFAYFLRVKTVWRWIKLSYAISSGLYAGLLIIYLVTGKSSRDLQFLSQMIILATWASGLWVSWIKLDAAKFVERKSREIEEKRISKEIKTRPR